MLNRLMAASFTVIAMLSVSVFAEDEPRYIEGKHYTKLSTPLKTTYRGEEIGEIVEFFSYTCIHCFNVEPGIERFLEEKPDNIRFTQVPAMFNDRQAPEARAHYVAKIMGIEEAPKAIFNRNFVDRKYLRTDKAFAGFFTQFGMTEDEYMAKAYSFAVDSMLKNSIYMTGTSNIGGTPAVVVNGKYEIQSSAVGGNEAALHVAKWLVEYEASKAE